MPSSPLEYLRHILDETQFIMKRTEGVSAESFSGDDTLKRAIVRSIEIIGEATKKISGDLKEVYPQVEWKSMAGMRDRLIHDYFGIDYELVWDVVQNKIPSLRNAIEEILRKEETVRTVLL
jgi:uncharacterized protein with HEPN domain